MPYRIIPPAITTTLARTTLIAGLILIPACRSPHAGVFEGVQPDMSKSDVVALLGKPSSTLACDDSTPSPWAERWHWGDTLGTMATNLAMPDQPPSTRVWTVWFDQRGRVIRSEAPAAEPAMADDTSWLPPAAPPR